MQFTNPQLAIQGNLFGILFIGLLAELPTILDSFSGLYSSDPSRICECKIIQHTRHIQ